MKKMVRIVLYRPAISQSDCGKAGPYQLAYNNMLLLTESAVHTRKYLLWRYAIRTERSEVRAAWRHNRYFPYGPNSRLIRALLYTHTSKTTKCQRFPLLLWTEVQPVHTPVRTQAYGPALSQSNFSILSVFCLVYNIRHYNVPSISTGAGPALLKYDWSKAGLRMDLQMFAYSHTVPRVLLIRMLWKTVSEIWKYTENNILWKLVWQCSEKFRNCSAISENSEKMFLIQIPEKTLFRHVFGKF